MATRTNRTGLARDLDLVELVAGTDDPGARTVTALARATGRDKTQVSRALATLVAAGVLDRDVDSRAHRIGPRLFAIAARSTHAVLVGAARRAMRSVAQDVGESVYLCVPQGDLVLTLHAELGTHGFRGTGWEGRVVSASPTSAGRVLLSDRPEDEVRALVAADRRRAADAERAHGDGAGFGVASLDIDGVLEAVRAAHADGYAVVDEEFEPGLVGASAPVHGADGAVLAAVNVVGPKRRLGHRLDGAAAAVRGAARAVERALGAEPLRVRTEGRPEGPSGRMNPWTGPSAPPTPSASTNGNPASSSSRSTDPRSATP